MWNPMGQNVSFCVIVPEKEVNSVNITNHEWKCAIEATSWPWVSICLLRLRGKVPSSLGMFSGVLKISSSLSCSSFSCWINTQEQNQVLFLWHFQTHLTGLKTCAGVFWSFCLATGVLGVRLSPPLFRRSLSLCRRMACRVVRYSKEKFPTVLQKSSALISLTIALE